MKIKEDVMTLEMDDLEICRRYREAKDKIKQLEILAQLNDTCSERILEILTEAGEIIAAPQKKARRNVRNELRLKQYVELSDKGATVAEAASALGVSRDAVYTISRKYDIPFAKKNYKEKAAP